MNTTKNELVDFFEQLDKRTQAGEIVWSQLSPTSYAATRDTASGKKRMTIQRSLSSRPNRMAGAHDIADEIRAALEVIPSHLIFQVEAIEGSDRRAEVSIDTRNREDLQQPLSRLYAAAEFSADAQTARVLRELVGS